jgi:hypothetical protein
VSDRQTYTSHRRYPWQRYLLPTVLFIAFFFAILEFRQPGILGRSWGLVSILICVGSILQWYYARAMVTKVQDRAIRSEENFRHFILTGKPLPAGLTLRQTVSLRFASDAELPGLAERALSEKLKGEAIKKSIKDWRPDNHRA